MNFAVYLVNSLTLHEALHIVAHYALSTKLEFVINS